MVRTAIVFSKEHTGRKYKKEQGIVTMHKLFALVAVVLLAGCNSVSSVVDGTTGIVSGVIKDVSDVTTYTLDAASGAVKAATPATPE